MQSRERFGQKTFLNCMKHYGYDIDSGGMCYGVSYMGVQAIILDNEDKFIQRMLDIADLNDQIERGEAPPELPVDIRAFFDGICLYHRAHAHADIFGDDVSRIQDWRLAAPIVTAAKLAEKGGFDKFAQFEGVYTVVDLIDMIDSLVTALRKTDNYEPVALTLSSCSHSICVGFYPDSNCFTLIDANKLPPTTFMANDLDFIVELISSLHLENVAVNQDSKIALGMQLYSSAPLAATRRAQFLSLNDGESEYSKRWLALNEVVNTNPRLTFQGCDGMTWLHVAIKSGDLVTVEKILQTEVGKSSLNSLVPLSPLEHAVSRGDYQMALLLLQHGASPNVQTDLFGKKNIIPLIGAVVNGDIEIAKLLLAYGADVNVSDPWTTITPLLAAVVSRHPSVELTQLLLASGANPLIKSRAALPHILADEGGDIHKLLKISYDLALYKNELAGDPNNREHSLLQSSSHLFSGRSVNAKLAAANVLQDVLTGKVSKDALASHEPTLNSDKELKAIYESCKELLPKLGSEHQSAADAAKPGS